MTRWRKLGWSTLNAACNLAIAGWFATEVQASESAGVAWFNFAGCAAWCAIALVEWQRDMRGA